MTTKHTKLLITLVAAGLTIGSGIAISQATEAKDDDAKEIQLFSQAKISLIDAIRAAEQKTGGKAMEAEVDDEAKTIQFEIEVVKEGAIHKVIVDGKTGLVLQVALDDESKESAEGHESENEAD